MTEEYYKVTNPNPQAITGSKLLDKYGNHVYHAGSIGHQFSPKQSTILDIMFLTKKQ